MVAIDSLSQTNLGNLFYLAFFKLIIIGDLDAFFPLIQMYFLKVPYYLDTLEVEKFWYQHLLGKEVLQCKGKDLRISCSPGVHTYHVSVLYNMLPVRLELGTIADTELSWSEGADI